MRLGVIQRWLVVPTLALVGALVLPAALMLARVSVCEPMRGGGFYRAGSFSLEAYWRLLSVDGANLIGFTVVFAVAVALGVVVLAWVVTWPMRDWRGGWLLGGMLLLAAPRLAGILGPLVVLKRLVGEGVLAAWLAEVYLITPYAGLALLIHLQGVDWGVLRTARGLGASRWQALRRVGIPLGLPGIWLAGQLAMGWGLGAFLGPELLGGPQHRTLASDLHHQAFDNSRWPVAAAEGVVLLALASGALAARPPRIFLGAKA